MKLDDLHTAQLLAKAREELVRLRDFGTMQIRFVGAFEDVKLDTAITDSCRPIVNRALDQRIGAIDADLAAIGVEIG